MSRRVQNGYVQRHGLAYVGKIWEDQANGKRKRKSISLGRCATKTGAKLRLKEWIAANLVNSAETFHWQNSGALTFKVQAEKWYQQMLTRSRRPVRRKTLQSWRGALDNYLLPSVGFLPLAEVTNSTLKRVVGELVAKKLAC